MEYSAGLSRACALDGIVGLEMAIWKKLSRQPGAIHRKTELDLRLYGAEQ